jgi:hypothetical protein
MVCFNALFSESFEWTKEDHKNMKSRQLVSSSAAKSGQASLWLICVETLVVSTLNDDILGAGGGGYLTTLSISELYIMFCTFIS